MSDFSDAYGETGYYDGTYSTSVQSSIDAGTTTAYGTSADYVSDTYGAMDASWDAWGASSQADSYATEAYYAGDSGAYEYWNSVSYDYEQASYAADAASYTAWDASYEASYAESAAWDTSYSSYDYSSSYTDYSAGSDWSYMNTDSGYDYSSTWAATDTVTDYYTDASW